MYTETRGSKKGYQTNISNISHVKIGCTFLKQINIFKMYMLMVTYAEIKNIVFV